MEWDRIRAEHEVESLRSSQSAVAEQWQPIIPTARRHAEPRHLSLDDAPRGGRQRSTSDPVSHYSSAAPSFLLGSSTGSEERRGREWADDWARRREAESQSMREAEWTRELEREWVEGVPHAPTGAGLEAREGTRKRTAAAVKAAFAAVETATTTKLND